jgi:outer membrane receptor protein involved in Fe transport
MTILVVSCALLVSAGQVPPVPPVEGPPGTQPTAGPIGPPADGPREGVPTIVVFGRETDLVGEARSATEGYVAGDALDVRPLLRPGAVLETVPGIVVTQHSGAGKANQFFLRGFNLDHGTDLAIRVAGVPNNLPSHGHGQGYNDLSPLLPELVDHVQFAKGPYNAAAGDFATAGHVELDYVDRLESGLALFEAGRFGRARALVADSIEMGSGTLLFGIESAQDDGPWDVEEDFAKLSGILRWSRGDRSAGSRVTFLGYDADWAATDHVARRAIDSGLIDRFGSLDPTSGGESSRHTLVGEWWGGSSFDEWRVRAYTFRYDLDLYSNFTYFLADPGQGDQILQEDRRWVQGLEAERSWEIDTDRRPSTLRVGMQLRNDVVDNALRNASARVVSGTVRSDEIVQTSLGAYGDVETRWTGTFRTYAGVRGDIYRFDVDSDLDANDGTETDSIVSPKLGLVLGPWGKTELYLEGGYGFHSNDARGVTLRDDPTTPALLDGTSVEPLVRQRGAELGIRTGAIDGLQSTLSLWYLESDSELLFVGDAGNTEPSGATERFGVEWTNVLAVRDWLELDLDAALSRARFVEAGDDDHVPGAIESVVAFGATVKDEGGHFVSLRGRYFGPRDLIEDGSVQSSSSFLVDAQAGWRFSEDWQLRLSVYNLFDREVSDIEYYYPSRLAGEPPGPDDGGYNDVHFHPALPLTFLVGLMARF